MTTSNGELRAQWSTAFVDDLPDDSFAYIEPGGKKDDEGKTTPRSLRHYPYKDADGKVDEAHVNNGLARAAQAIHAGGEAAEIAQKALPKLDTAKKSLDEKNSAPNDAELRDFDEDDEDSAINSAGPLADLLDFWLDEFAEADGEPSDQQLAACAATFANYPGVYDADAFAEWLAYEAVEPLDQKVDDAEEDEPDESGQRSEQRVGTGQDNNPTGKNQHSHGRRRKGTGRRRKSTGHRHSHRRRARRRGDQAVGVESRSRATGEVEVRTVAFSDFTFEERADSTMPTLRGYAAVFGSLSNNLGGFREEIRQGAFSKYLASDPAEHDTVALINHDPNLVLGRRSAGTLRLKEDERGLAIEVDPPDTTYARDLVTLMKRGDMNKMSFAFIAGADDWQVDQRGTVRTVTEMRTVRDVSAVTYPAYTATNIAARSDQGAGAEAQQGDEEQEQSLAYMRARLRLAQADS